MSRQVETATEKESNRIHSKADPTMAMNEAEPCAYLTFGPVCVSEHVLTGFLQRPSRRLSGRCSRLFEQSSTETYLACP